jgi:hypothetical protein
MSSSVTKSLCPPDVGDARKAQRCGLLLWGGGFGDGGAAFFRKPQVNDTNAEASRQVAINKLDVSPNQCVRFSGQVQVLRVLFHIRLPLLAVFRWEECFLLTRKIIHGYYHCNN